MENNQENKQSLATNDNAVFGTSSDAIIEGLHQGQFVESGSEGMLNDGDKRIVNEQEQNEIVNPAEADADTATVPSEKASASPQDSTSGNNDSGPAAPLKDSSAASTKTD